MPKPQGVIAQWPVLSATPAGNPPTGHVFVYYKSTDGKLYTKNSAGVESAITPTYPIAISQGGTGQTTATGARIALGAPSQYETWFANITAGTWNTVTHNLSTAYIAVQFLVGTPSVPYELEWENVAGDDSIRFRADLALADVGVLVMGY